LLYTETFSIPKIFFTLSHFNILRSSLSRELAMRHCYAFGNASSVTASEASMSTSPIGNMTVMGGWRHDQEMIKDHPVQTGISFCCPSKRSVSLSVLFTVVCDYYWKRNYGETNVQALCFSLPALFNGWGYSRALCHLFGSGACGAANTARISRSACFAPAWRCLMRAARLAILRVQDPRLPRQRGECIPGDRKRIFQRGWRRVLWPYRLPFLNDPVLSLRCRGEKSTANLYSSTSSC